MFHQLVYRTRKDIKAVVHDHPQALVAFSIVSENNAKVFAEGIDNRYALKIMAL